MTLIFKAHDGSEHDFDALPPVSRQGLVNRAVAHVFGNEVASQVVGHIRSAIAGEEGKATAVTTDQVKAYREAHSDEVSAKHREYQDAKLKQILEGELGVRATGTGASIDPLTKEMLRIARDEIRQIFTKKGWKFPTKEETFKVNDVELDAPGWVDRWLNVSNDKLAGGKGEPNQPRIQRLAERNLKARQDAAKRIAAAATEAEGAEGL